MKLESIDVNDIANSITIKVVLVGVRVFKLRLMLGVFFIRLGARIIGCGIQID